MPVHYGCPDLRYILITNVKMFSVHVETTISFLLVLSVIIHILHLYALMKTMKVLFFCTAHTKSLIFLMVYIFMLNISS